MSYSQAYQSYHEYGRNQDGSAEARPQSSCPESAQRPQICEKKSWVYSKCFLHILGSILSVCALGMCLALLHDNRTSGYPDTENLASYSIPLPGATLIWSVAELIVRAIHKFETGIHPGCQVAACLFLWLAGVVVAYYEWIYFHSSYIYCRAEDPLFLDYYDDICRGQWASKEGLWAAICVFTTVILIVYLVLFIFSCIDTARRNAAKKLAPTPKEARG